MTAPRHIALFTPAWPGQKTPNGIATSVYNLATGLTGMGHPPVIVTPLVDGDCPPDIHVVEVPELPWPLWDRLRGKFGAGPDRDALERHWLRRLVMAVETARSQHGAEVLIVEETNGWAQGLSRHIPVIVFLHGPWCLHKHVASLGAAEDAGREARERAGFEAAAGLIAPSHNVLAAVDAAADVLHIPRIVLPNSLWAEPAKTPAAALPTRDILFVGRVDFHKGADTVVEAFARLAGRDPDVRLTFVGPENRKASDFTVEKLMAGLPAEMAARIDYKGSLGREDVARLRDSHAIALIASRYENLNYTLLEAMAAGQAVVSTEVGGPAEVLEDGITALLVPPEDPEAMAAALARLVGNAALARRLGAAAQDRLLRDFSPETIARQTVAFAETVLGGWQDQDAGQDGGLPVRRT